MKLYRYTQRAITPHGQLVEPGEEVLLTDDVIPSAHMIDVHAESQARLAGLNYEDVHAAIHEMPPAQPDHLNLTPVRTGPVLAWVGPTEVAPAAPAVPPPPPVVDEPAPVAEVAPVMDPPAEEVPVAAEPVPEG